MGDMVPIGSRPAKRSEIPLRPTDARQILEWSKPKKTGLWIGKIGGAMLKILRKTSLLFSSRWNAPRFLGAFLVIGLSVADPSLAQDSSAKANLLFAETLKLHASAQELDGAPRKQALGDVLNRLNTIAENYPDSIPGQRIRAGQALGSIDIAAIRQEVGAGEKTADKATLPPEPDWMLAAGALPRDGVTVAGNGAIRHQQIVLMEMPSERGEAVSARAYLAPIGSEALLVQWLPDRGALDLALFDTQARMKLAGMPSQSLKPGDGVLSVQDIDWSDAGLLTRVVLSRPTGDPVELVPDRTAKTLVRPTPDQPPSSGQAPDGAGAEAVAKTDPASPQEPPALKVEEISHGHYDQTLPWVPSEPADAAPAPIAAAHPAPREWYRSIVPEGFVGTGFGHGDFPSIGQRTHAGVDIVGECGLDVVVPYPGTVTRIIKAENPEFAITGNAVLIDHGKVEDIDTWTFYANLAQAPTVEGGAIAAGAVIGQIGKSRHAPGCHLDFEVRNFAGRLGVLHPEWNQMNAYGDWRDDSVFLTGWTAPEEWGKARAFERAMAEAGGLEFAQKLGYYAKPRSFALRGDPNQGLNMRMKLSAHWEPDGLHVTVHSFVAAFMQDATINPIGENDSFTTEFFVFSQKDCDDCEPIQTMRVPSGMNFENGRLSRLPEPVHFVVSNEMLQEADKIGVTIVGGWKTIFNFSDMLDLSTPWHVGAKRAVSSGWRSDMKTALSDCLAELPELPEAVSLRFLIGVDGKPIPSSFAPVSELSNETLTIVRGRVLACAPEGFDLRRQEYLDWRDVELSLAPGFKKGVLKIDLD